MEEEVKEGQKTSRFKYYFPIAYFFLVASADYSKYKAKKEEEDREAGITKRNESPTFMSVAGNAGLFGLIFAVFLIFPLLYIELPFIAPVMFIYFKKKEKENGSDGLPLDWVDLLKVGTVWVLFAFSCLIVLDNTLFNPPKHFDQSDLMAILMLAAPIIPSAFFLYKWLFGKGALTNTIEKTRQKVCEAAELDDQSKKINS